ncbi:tricarballylate/proton symporter TcuC [Bartonella sp. LJL80]
MTKSNKFMTIFRVVSGNFMEMFDFMVYGYYASYIGDAFFPSHDPTASLLKSFAAFGVGFLMRPLGAFVLGAYTDRVGRKKGLLLTLTLMATGTLLLAITPDYAYIGVLAPMIVLLSRLLQGFSAGAELGGTSVYLAEISNNTNRGFYVSWQSASQQVSVIFASGLGVLLHSFFSVDFIAGFGWRIPFLIGCLIVPVLFYIRSSMMESEVFEKNKSRPGIKEVFHSIVADYPVILLGMMMVGMTTATFYLITAYMPTFGRVELKLTAMESLIITTCIGFSNFFWLPVMGSVSDRLGRKPILIAATIGTIITAFPLMLWLASAPSFPRLLIVGMWLSFLYGSYNGAMVVALTEVMPAAVRATGFSLAYSLATTIFGGFTPFICTWLINMARHSLSADHAWIADAMPGVWLTVIALMSVIAVFALYRIRSHLSNAHTVEL